MNFITDIQMQQYESIIKKIEEEFKENARLKAELDKINSKIFLQKLKKNKMIGKLSHVNVKIFRKILDVYSLYEKEILTSFDDLKECCNSKYYLIEIYLSKVLIQKLRNLKWSLLINIHYENANINKVINSINKTCIMDVIPVDEMVLNCTLEVDIVLQLDSALFINITKQEIDVSYHISTTLYNKNELNWAQKALKIAQLYRKDIDFDKCTFSMLDYELKLHCSVQTLIEKFIKNCYHAMDLDTLNELRNGEINKINFTLGYGQQEPYSVTYNNGNVTIKAHYQDLYLLKKFFFTEFHSHEKDEEYRNLTVGKFQYADAYDPFTLSLYYNEIRKRWQSILPV